MAEAGTIDSLQIEIEASSKSAVAQINNLANALKRLKAATNGGLNIGNFKKELGKLGGNEYTKIERLAKALQGLKNVKLDDKIGNSMLKIADACELIEQQHIDKLTKFGNALQTIKTVSTRGYDKLPAAILNIAAAVDSITDDSIARLSRLTIALSRLRGVDLSGLGTVLRAQNAAHKKLADVTGTASPAVSGKSGAGGESGEDELTQRVRQAAKPATALGSATKAMLQTLVNDLKRVASAALSAAKAIGGKFLSALKSVTSAAIGFGKNILIAPFQALTSRVKALTDKMNNLISSFKRIMFYRVIRMIIKEIGEAMKEGEENAYWYSKTLGTATNYISEAYDRFASVSAMMKNQVGAAWATLFANIEPIITKIVEMVSRAVEVVTMFFAKLGGKNTYLKAINYGKEWAETTEDDSKAAEDWAKAAEESSKAAEEWRNQLMGFDEINKLDAPDESSKDKNKNKNKDKNKDKDKKPDYGDMFEEVPIESGIGDLAQKIKDLWNAQEWKALGELIGNTLNDLFPSREKWIEWGTKLGTWINGAIQTAYYALKTIDFHEWGDRIAAGINAALEQIDFGIWGRLLVRKITAALDFLLGLLGGLKWDLVGKSIGDFLRGALDEATEWLLSYDWGKMAKAMWNNIKAMIDGFDVPAFAKSLGNFIVTAANSAADFLNGLDFTDIVNTITSTIKDFFDNVGIDNIVAAIKNLWQAIKKAFIDTMTAFGEWLKSKNEDGAFGKAGRNFNEAILNFLADLKEMSASVPWHEIATAIGDFLKEIDWLAIFKGVWEVVSPAFKEAAALFFGEGGSAVRHLGEAILGIRMVFSGAKAATVYAAARTFAKMIGKEVAGTATEVEAAATATGGAFAKFGPVFTSFGESVKGGVSAAASWLTTGLSEFTVAGTTLLTGAAAAFTTLGLAVGDALLVQYDVNALKEAHNTYKMQEEAFQRNIEANAHGFVEVLKKSGREAADQYAQMVVGINTSGMEINEAVKAIKEKTAEQYADMPHSMWEGFKQNWQYYFGKGSSGGLVVLLEDAFKGAVNGIKKLLGIHSPSTVFAEIGRNMVEGLLAGLKEKWKDIESFFTQTIPDLVKKASSAWDELKQKTSETWGNVKETISKKAAEIKSAASEKLSTVASIVSEKWEGVKEKTSSTWENIKSVVSEKWNAITSTSQNAASNLQNSMSGAFNNVQSAVVNTTGQVSNEMNNNWSNIANIVVNSMMNMANQIQQIFNNLVQQVSAATTQIHNMANQARNDAASINMPTANNTYNPNVSWHAKGGIVDSTTLFGIGEAGAEAIIPLERNTEWIGRVAAEMNNQNSDRYEDSSEVVVSALYTICDRIIRAMPSEDGDIDMDSLARSITRIQRRQARAVG